MSFIESLKDIKKFKQRLWSLDDQNRHTSLPKFTSRQARDTELPDYALAFLNEIARFSTFRNHLDPFAQIYSPSIALDLGATTAFFMNSRLGEFAKELLSSREIIVESGDSAFLLDSFVGKFDLITSFLPFGWKLQSDEKKLLQTPFSGPYDRSHVIIYKSLKLLSDAGTAMFVVPNGFFIHGNIEPELESCGCFIDAIFALQPGALPNTQVHSNIVVIKRTPEKFTFFSELLEDHKTIHRIIDQYRERRIGEGSQLIPRGSFKGAASIRVQAQIGVLETQYKTYSSHRLGDIAEMKTCRTGGEFDEVDNAVYVPKVGNSSPVANLADATIKQQNYHQLKLNSDIVLNGYMESFFRSQMGCQLLELGKQGIIPSLSLAILKDMSVPIPSISEQKDIIATMGKLSKLKVKLSEFEAELSVNPTSSVAVLGQLDNMIEVIEGLTEGDKIRSMVRDGESTWLEFKETLSWNIHSQQKDVAMEIACLKTIVGFLNTDGGVLLIGVADNGSIPGVDFEIEKLHKSNIDKFQTGFKNLLKDRIGEQFYPHISVTINSVDGAQVVRVECRRSEPCFLMNPQTKKEEFYVRAPAATDQLEGRKQMEYISRHWPS